MAENTWCQRWHSRGKNVFHFRSRHKIQIRLAYLNAICDCSADRPVDKMNLMAFNRLIFQQQHILSAAVRHGKHQEFWNSFKRF